jgi:hypothetical protein
MFKKIKLCDRLNLNNILEKEIKKLKEKKGKKT